MAGSGAAVVLSVVGVLTFAPGEAPDKPADHPLAAQPTLVPLPPVVPVAPLLPGPDSLGILGSGVLDGLTAAGQPEPQVAPPPAENAGQSQLHNGSEPGTKARPVVKRTPDLPARTDAPAPKRVVAAPAVPAPAPAKPAPAPPPADPVVYPYGPDPYGAYPDPYGAYPSGPGGNGSPYCH